MRLKKDYSSREVTALTGLSARQLQWWDARRLFRSSVPAHRTPAGGFTERRYSPVDLLELVALADLRRRGFSVQRIRDILRALRDRFGIRLYDAIGGGDVQLLTDRQDVYVRTTKGELFNLLRSPDQPLLVLGAQDELKGLSLHMRPRRSSRKKKAKKKAP